MKKNLKFLRNLDRKRRTAVLAIIARISIGDFSNLDIKKLKGGNLYRIRKGKVRIQYFLDDVGNAVIVSVNFRDETTYN